MKALTSAVVLAATAMPLSAQEAPRTGPVFADFGPHYAIAGIENVPADTEFSHSFDVAQNAQGEARNRGFESAARFMNMHAAAGVDPSNIRLAVVVHGAALRDLLTDEAYAAKGYGEKNPSGAMVAAMLDAGVRFMVCGQSAYGAGFAQEDFIEGTEMALSAMTAHALLQQRGYTVNPF